MELQESLAPLYYLYGTTLLYSVEESDVMMAKGGGNAAADVELEPVEPRGEEEGEEAAVAVDPAEDLQIAWENLDLARSIVSRFVEDDNPLTPEQRTDLLLDLT